MITILRMITADSAKNHVDNNNDMDWPLPIRNHRPNTPEDHNLFDEKHLGQECYSPVQAFLVFDSQYDG